MKATLENSETQAELIKAIALYIFPLDVDYCREAAKDMLNQASRQESIAVLNPNHPQSKNDLLRLQGKALRTLCDYVDTLKEIEKVKEQIKKDEQNQQTISRLFL